MLFGAPTSPDLSSFLVAAEQFRHVMLQQMFLAGDIRQNLCPFPLH